MAGQVGWSRVCKGGGVGQGLPQPVPWPLLVEVCCPRDWVGGACWGQKGQHHDQQERGPLVITDRGRGSWRVLPLHWYAALAQGRGWPGIRVPKMAAKCW